MVEVSELFKDMVRADWNKGPEAIIGGVVYEAWQHCGDDDEDEEAQDNRGRILLSIIEQCRDLGPEVFLERFSFWVNRNVRVIY